MGQARYSQPSVRQADPRAGDEAEPACVAATWPRTSPAKELRSAMPIAGVAERLRLLHQLLRVRGAVEEGEVGERAEFGVTPAHSKRPCSHQRGASPGRTWPERQTQRRAPPASSTR